MKVTCLLSIPAFFIIRYMSSLKSFLVYYFFISTVSIRHSSNAEAIVIKDFFPEPPTPTNIK